MKVIDILNEAYKGTLPDRFKFDFENNLLTPCTYIKKENRIRHNSFYDVIFKLDDLDREIEIIEEPEKGGVMMVSYYELLGMIKEGKQPEKILCKENIYIWKDGAKYCRENYDYYLTDVFYEIEMFNKEIEIIEEPEESDKDKIEELTSYISVGFKGNADSENVFNTCKKIGDKINELVRVVNELKAKE